VKRQIPTKESAKMSHRNSISVVVQGGNTSENSAITSIIHSALRSHGFTNVFNDQLEEQTNNSISVLDLVRSRNPDLLDTPVMIIGQCYEAVTEEEISIHNQLQHGAFSQAAMLC
jgi:hypothetical protein